MIGLLAAVLLHWNVMACQAGQPYGQCRTMVALVSVESSGCRDLVGDHGTSLGCSQVSMWAARKVGYKGPTGPLLENRKVNMEVAAKYLAYCMAQTHSYRQGILCYNAGVDHSEYTARGPRRPLTWAEINCDPYVLKVLSRLPAETSPTVPRHRALDAVAPGCPAASPLASSSRMRGAGPVAFLWTMPSRTVSPPASGSPGAPQAALALPTPHKAGRDVLGPKRERPGMVSPQAGRRRRAR